MSSLLAWLALVFASAYAYAAWASQPVETTEAVVKADFAKWVDYPLVKTKFGVYNSRKADEVVAVADCTRFEIPVAKYAPHGWDGRVIITFILQNAGPNVRAKVAVR